MMNNKQGVRTGVCEYEKAPENRTGRRTFLFLDPELECLVIHSRPIHPTLAEGINIHAPFLRKWVIKNDSVKRN